MSGSSRIAPYKAISGREMAHSGAISRAFSGLLLSVGAGLRRAAAGDVERPLQWRYVVGSFVVRIPVSTAEAMLAPEAITLAIMTWLIAQNMCWLKLLRLAKSRDLDLRQPSQAGTVWAIFG